MNSDEITRLGEADVHDIVADLHLSVALPDGSRHAQQIKIGRPLSVDTLHVCQVMSDGPILIASPCVGDNSFQALNMALAVVRATLHEAVNDSKYVLHYGDGKEAMTLEFLDSVLYADDYAKKSNTSLYQTLSR